MGKVQGCQVGNHQESRIDGNGLRGNMLRNRILVPLVGLGLVLSVACSSSDKKMVKSAGATATKETMKKMEGKKAEMKGQMKGHMVCNTGKDTRELLIEKSEEASKFDLVYTKRGKSQNIANGSWAHCERISARVAQTLTEAGFSCQ